MNPPRIASWLLERLGPENGPLAGDVREEYQRGRSTVWYWRQVLLAIAFNEPKRVVHIGAVVLSVVLIVPACLLVTSGALYGLVDLPMLSNALDFDSLVFHPIVILGGLMFALGINAASLVQIRLANGTMTSTLRLRGQVVRLSLVTLIGLLSSIIFVYLLAENLQIFAP